MPNPQMLEVSDEKVRGLSVTLTRAIKPSLNDQCGPVTLV